MIYGEAANKISYELFCIKMCRITRNSVTDAKPRQKTTTFSHKELTDGLITHH